MFKKAMVLALIATGITAGGAVSAPILGASGSFSLSIRGFVPVICRANVQATQIQPKEGSVSLGTLNEFCNNARGYEVWADYSPGLSDAALVVDNKVVDLDAGGSTRLLQVPHAGAAERSLALNLPSSTASGSISIRVVAL